MLHVLWYKISWLSSVLFSFKSTRYWWYLVIHLEHMLVINWKHCVRLLLWINQRKQIIIIVFQFPIFSPQSHDEYEQLCRKQNLKSLKHISLVLDNNVSFFLLLFKVLFLNVFIMIYYMITIPRKINYFIFINIFLVFICRISREVAIDFTITLG